MGDKSYQELNTQELEYSIFLSAMLSVHFGA